MKLYGSITSPFVRRVRVVAEEVGVKFELVNTMADEGQVALKKVTPIWRVPMAEIDGTVLFDSHVLIDYLFARHGAGSLRLPTDGERWREANVLTVIDAATEAAINVRYLRLDGVDPVGVPYLAKQKARVDSAVAWIERELRGAFFTDEARLGMTEIALVTLLDWMIFRDEFPVKQRPKLMRFLEGHAGRGSLESTRPA